jgi:hypothetical protein
MRQNKSANSRSLKIHFTLFRKSSGECGEPLVAIVNKPKDKNAA